MGRIVRRARSGSPDPAASASNAGLRHVNDGEPGFRRAAAGQAFRYLQPDGRVVRDSETLLRIRSLVIPPAWTDVWICTDEKGHLQATGRDARGRKQYRYHPRWREVRDETKYERMIEFAAALALIRRRTEADLRRRGLPREKVLAALVQLLEKTLIRVGNEEYARDNRSFGLTTLRNGHVDVKGATMKFQFRGKSGKRHEVDLNDRRLARVVRDCRELPGQELFGYLDDEGNPANVGSADVNAYLSEITGRDFTAKDFRTWAGTVLVTTALQEFLAFDSQAAAKKNILLAIEAVAGMLGNTRAVCHKSYIHPGILDAYLDGSMMRVLRQRARAKPSKSLAHLRPQEAAVLAILNARLERDARVKRAGVRAGARGQRPPDSPLSFNAGIRRRMRPAAARRIAQHGAGSAPG